MPDSIDLELVAPPGFGSTAEFREAVMTALAVREDEIAAAMKPEGTPFLGQRRVLAQRWTDRPPQVNRGGN